MTEGAAGWWLSSRSWGAAVSRCFLACNGSPCLRPCVHGASIGGGGGGDLVTGELTQRWLSDQRDASSLQEDGWSVSSSGTDDDADADLHSFLREEHQKEERGVVTPPSRARLGVHPGGAAGRLQDGTGGSGQLRPVG
jgi:hypothetical protein